MIQEAKQQPTRNRWFIGNVAIDGPLVLGPMAGYTSPPLRLLCRRAGAHLVYSEMVAVQGLRHRNRKTFALLETLPEEHPVAVQIFGGEPDVMAAAVPYITEAGADIIDINMGCPVPKVMRSEGGAALMFDHDRAVEIARAVVEESSIPVTCKIRAGINQGDDTYIELAQRLQDVGAAAIAIHGRTVRQGFKGEADHRPAGRLVECLDVPVMASGDVFSPTMPEAILEDTGCAGVMFARGAVGRPWIFAQANAVLRGETAPEAPPVAARMGIALCQAQMMALASEERQAVHEMRGHLAWYTKGMSGGKRLREHLNHIDTLGEMAGLMQEYLIYRAEPS